MRETIDMTGRIIGKLTVLSETVRASKTREAHWLCRCDCGKEIIVTGTRLRNGSMKSCSCAKTTHGHCSKGERSPEYRTWRGMHLRCESPASVSYQYYGARGISVCDRWKLFSAFLEDMGLRPEGKTLDRIDNNGNYEPGNCKWSTQAEQHNNKRHKGTAKCL